MKIRRSFNLNRAQILAIWDIGLTISTIIIGSIELLTPPDALNPIYVNQRYSSSFTIIFFLRFIPAVIAWTLILSRAKIAKIVGYYVVSIITWYFLTVLFIWVMNGVEYLCGAARLIIAGALIYHLKYNDTDSKEESKPKEKDIIEEENEVDDQDETLLKEER